MKVRVSALIISLLYIQVSGIQQNGASNNNLSNSILNRTSVLQSQSSFQNKINQLPTSQANNLQQSESLKLAKNFQQAFNKQPTTNIQNINAQQQSLNMQNSMQPTKPQSTNSNLQQTMVVQQQPVNFKQSINANYPSNLQQNMNLQQQNQNTGNLQTLRQASDVSVLPNAQFSPQFTQSQYLGGNPTSNAAVITSIPSSQSNLCNLNSPGEVTVLCPQNQQMSYGNVPYGLDISQVTNNPAAILAPASAGLNNQPSVMTVIAPPQQNQQSYLLQNSVIQNPSDYPNQITIIKSIQPHSSVQSLMNQDQKPISFLPSNVPQTSLDSYTDVPSISSILASSLTKQASKSSNLKSLLPLIFNLIKERNNCDCNHQCDCSKKTQNKKYFQPDLTLNYFNDYSDEFDSYENRKNSRKYGKRKNVKPVSAEYDYSEEFQDD